LVTTEARKAFLKAFSQDVVLSQFEGFKIRARKQR
jgi:hypothetical protein